MRICLVYFISSIIACNLGFATQNKGNNYDDDWKTSSSCQQKNNKLCGGYYKQPEYPLAISKGHPPDTIIINADQTKLVSKGLSNFDGNVSVVKNDQQITAKHATVQQNEQGDFTEVAASGDVKLIQPGMRLIGSSAKVVAKPSYKLIRDAKYRMYDRHARGCASQIEVFQDNEMLMPNATYTTCKPGDNAWYLSAQKVKLNKTTGRGEAWHAKMHVKDVPVLYWPYVNFPIDKRRQTGFLHPSVSSSSKHGATLNTPFYWNMAENYDYTLAPAYMSKRNLKLDNNFRYLTSSSNGALRFDILPQDKNNKDFTQQKLASSEISTNDLRYRKLRTKNSRYSLWWANQTALNPDWNFNVNYRRIGDDNYLQDFGQDIGQSTMNVASNSNFGSTLEESALNSTSHVEQSTSIENTNNYGVLKFSLLQYQTLYPYEGPLATEQYKKLPEITWNSHYIYLNDRTRGRYNVSYADFRLRSFDGLATNTTGKRAHARPSLEHPLIYPAGYIKPRMQIDALSYHDLKLSQIDQSINKPKQQSRAIPIFDVDNGLNFSRENTAWRQTLEPRMYYLYVPRHEQSRYPIFDSGATEFSYDQLFRDNRFSGVDRLAEANQVTFGMRTALFPDSSNTHTEDFAEKASFGVARTRYMRGLTPQFGENLEFGRWSPLAFLLNYQLTPQMLIEANVVRQKLNQTRSTTVNTQYKPDDEKIINFGYQYLRFATVPQHQWQTSGLWKIKDNLNLVGKFDYDLSQHRVVYTLAGMEVHGCCTILRLAWARNLFPTENFMQKRYDNKFLAQLVFKGFAGAGNLESNYLAGKIPGYAAKDQVF